MKKNLLLINILLVAILFGCNMGTKNKQGKTMENKIEKSVFGVMPDSTEVYLYTLTNKNGMVAKITNYGGIVTEIIVPDKEGNFENVVLGFDKLDGYTCEAYTSGIPYFGALIGRYGNRIGVGKFSIDGVDYQVEVNSNGQHLHGGTMGFHAVVWDAEEMMTDEGPALKLNYLSKDGEMGYPGNCKVTATYTLTNENGLKTAFEAETDKPTVINLTQHSYFNLTGAKEDILSHKLMIKADSFTDVDENLITTGEIKSVIGSALDFTKSKAIGQDIEEFENGYDHNYVLNDQSSGLKEIAIVKEEKSGRVLKVFTTEPGVQFYSGGFLNGALVGVGGKTYNRFYGFCLEPQHYPDSPNKPDFPSTVLRPGEKYSHIMEFRFEVEK